MRRTLTNHGRAPPGERGQRGKIPLHRDGRQRVIAVQGRIQREGEVVHLVAHRLVDLSAELATVGSRDAAFPLSHGRGDQVTHAGGGPDPRELPPEGLRTRDIYVPDLHIDTIKAKSRDFH